MSKTFENKYLGTHLSLEKQGFFEWITATDEQVKDYSETATYTTSFELSNEETKQSLNISFEHISSIANITLNGQELRSLWTSPFRMDISSGAKSGTNVLEVLVSNNWVNHLLL